MKKLSTWVCRHPVIFACYLAHSVVCGAVMASGHIALGAFFLALAYTALCISLNRHAKRLLCVALAVSLCAVPRQAHAVQYALGGVVLLAACGLGYLGCRMANCAKKIPANRGTNLVEEFHVAGEDCEYGAAFFWPQECYVERFANTNRVPVVTVLNIFVESQTNCTTSLVFDVESQLVQDLKGLKEELAFHGLSVPDSPRISESYSRNRHPVTAEQVPISFNFTTRTATIGKGGVAIRVESSLDLKDWTLLANLNAAVGTTNALADVSYGRAFYRVTTGH